MHRASLFVAAAVGAFGLVQAMPARAATTPVVASYLASWNMAGGPQGTDLSGASILWQWSGSSYVSPSTKAAAACQGYWAFYLNPTTVSLDSTATGPSRTCAVQAGWNMVGNPFAGTAVIPAGLTAYWWNPDENTYDLVSAIPPGGAVWMYASVASSVTLQYLPASTPVPSLLTISNAAFTGPYTVHVGDSIKMILPAYVAYSASADPAYLHIELAGQMASTSCSNGSPCDITFSSSFWIWHAIAAGTTTIMAQQLCTGSTPCQPPIFFQITILP